eukprot:scaffold592468_cov33-Prasinocladus_malaysianus.AAC.1
MELMCQVKDVREVQRANIAKWIGIEDWPHDNKNQSSKDPWKEDDDAEGDGDDKEHGKIHQILSIALVALAASSCCCLSCMCYCCAKSAELLTAVGMQQDTMTRQNSSSAPTLVTFGSDRQSQTNAHP